MNLRNILVTLVLVVIYFGSVLFRVRLSTNPEYYDARDPTAFYWTENALQYHYAELIANGKSIPDFDPKLQAPDGVRIFENLTIFMEYPCGWLYRIFNLKKYNILFHTWTILYIALLSSLIIFASYFFSRALGINPTYSLLSGLLSSFSLVAVGRSIFGFLNEDFALPFIFLGLGFFILALREKQKDFLFGLFAGLFFGISLASWHFSRFILLTIVFCNVVNMWLFTASAEERQRNARVLLFSLLLPVVFSFVIPVLCTQHFYFSIPVVLGIGASIGVLFFNGEENRMLFSSPRGRLAVLIGIIFLVTSILIAKFYPEGEYQHVWSLFLNKLKYFGIKPAMPSMIDYPARSLWIEAFNSPHPVTFFKDFFPIIIPSLLGFIYLIKKRKSDVAVRLFLFLAVVFFILYLTIERIGVVANFFITILAVSLGLQNFGKHKKSSRLIILFSLLAIFIFNTYQVYNFHRPTLYLKTLRGIFGNEKNILLHNWRLNDVELVRYIKHKTPPDAIFLSRFSVGPLILAYADRPIALQPKFEVRNCQKRVKEYLEAIYSQEDNFYSLCKKWQIGYFLYDIRIGLDNTRDAERWVSNNLLLSKNSTAFLMHFHPEKLKHFQLVYQNNFYRLYEVLQEGKIPRVLQFAYQPIYDIIQFGPQTDTNYFDDSFTTGVANRVFRAKSLLQKGNEILVRNPSRAIDLLKMSLAIYPSLISSKTTLGIAYILSGEIEQGFNLCQKEIEENPLLPLAHYNLAYAYVAKNNLNEAKKELFKTLELDPNFKPAREMLREIDGIR